MSEIAVRSLEKTYSSGTTALHDVSFEVRSGEFVSIVGPSGCGKSTLLRIMSGLDSNTGGSIVASQDSNGGLASAIVFQEHAQLFPWMRLRQNVAFAFDALGLPHAEVARRVKEHLDEVGLGDFLHAYPHELSGGMMQRAAVARAFAVDAPLLFMDEPFGALDEQTRISLASVLERLWNRTGKTVLFVTHSIEEAVTLSDRIVVMSKHPGTVREIITVDLPRPRDPIVLRGNAVFHNHVAHIWDLLR